MAHDSDSFGLPAGWSLPPSRRPIGIFPHISAHDVAGRLFCTVDDNLPVFVFPLFLSHRLSSRIHQRPLATGCADADGHQQHQGEPDIRGDGAAGHDETEAAFGKVCCTAAWRLFCRTPYADLTLQGGQGGVDTREIRGPSLRKQRGQGRDTGVCRYALIFVCGHVRMHVRK